MSVREEAAGKSADAQERPRRALLDTLRRQGIRDEAVLQAIADVPRQEFVPDELASSAWDNRPLPIGEGQTISQPYIVALMTELADVGPGDRVLDVGTGSGYQAAVLARLGCEVYSIERVPRLANRAADLLERLGLAEIRQRIGDGWRGWAEHAPYDAILVTAAPDRVPPPLIEQLGVGGKLVIPVGGQHESQSLDVITRTEDGHERRQVAPVRFVPLVPEESD